VDRNLLYDADALCPQRLDFCRIVGEQAHLLEAEVEQDVRGKAIVTRIDRCADLDIGIDRIEPLIL